MASEEAAMAMAGPAIQRAITKYDMDGKHGVAWEAIVAAVEPYPALCWEQEIMPGQAACFPANRGGAGFSLQTAYANAGMHFASGYSYKKAAMDNWSVQVLSGTHAALESQEFNRRQDEASGIPSVSQHLVDTFGGSHGQGFLRAVVAGLPCDDKRLAPTGFLDKNYLVEVQPGLRQALKGLPFKVLSARLVAKFPDIVNIGSKALNTKGTTCITELEGMLTMHSCFQAAKKTCKEMTDDDAWERAQCEASRAEPFWAGWASSLKGAAMGVSMDQLREAISMQAIGIKHPEGASPSYGHLGGNFLHKVGALKWSDLVPHTNVRMACIMAALNAPVDKVLDGRCVLLTAQDIGKLMAKQNTSIVAEAEKMLLNAKQLAEDIQLPFQQRMRLLLKFDSHVIYHLLGKGWASKYNVIFHQLADVGRWFMDEVTKVVGHFVMWEWGTSGSASAEPAKAAGETPTQPVDLKSPAFQLGKLGFEVDGHVHKKKPDEGEKVFMWRIVDITDMVVHLKATGMHAADQELKVPVEDFKGAWGVTKAKAQTLVDYASALPEDSLQWEIEGVKATVTLALRQLWAKHAKDQTPPNIEIFSNPSVVKVCSNFQAGKLLLIPATRLIKDRTKGEIPKVPERGLDLGVMIQAPFETVAFTLMPTFVTKGDAKFVAPFWAVPKRGDEGPNMVLTKVKVTINNVEINIPVMKNKRALTSGEELQLCTPKRDSEAAKGANKKQKCS